MNTFQTMQRKAIVEVKFAFPNEIDGVIKRLCGAPGTPYRKAEEVPFIRAFFIEETKAADFEGLEPGQIKHLVSTIDADRIGDVMMPKGVDLRDYRKNPIVLWGHSYMEPDNIIGKNLWIKPDDAGILALTQMDIESEKAAKVFRLYQKGLLKAWSIGFIPLKWKRVTPDGKPEPENVIDLRRALPGEPQVIHEKWLMLEYSAVAVPMNPKALTERVAKEYELSEEDLKEFELTVEKAGEEAPDDKTYFDQGGEEAHGEEGQASIPAEKEESPAEGEAPAVGTGEGNGDGDEKAEAPDAGAGGVLNKDIEVIEMTVDLTVKEGRVLSEKSRQLVMAAREKLNAVDLACKEATVALTELLAAAEQKSILDLMEEAGLSVETKDEGGVLFIGEEAVEFTNELKSLALEQDEETCHLVVDEKKVLT